MLRQKSKMHLRSQAIALLTAALLATGPATAAPFVLQPTAVDTNAAGQFDIFTAENLINQSGLSKPYTSGVTEFGAYTAATTHIQSGGFWAPNNFSTTSATIDFDLGGSFTIESIAIWSRGDSNQLRSIRDFELVAADNDAFTGAVSLGSYVNPPNGITGNNSPSPAQVYTFTPTEASYVRMVINSINGGDTMHISEVAFGGVPEPTSITLLGLGGLLVVLRRRSSRDDAKFPPSSRPACPATRPIHVGTCGCATV